MQTYIRAVSRLGYITLSHIQPNFKLYPTTKYNHQIETYNVDHNSANFQTCKYHMLCKYVEYNKTPASLFISIINPFSRHLIFVGGHF